MCDLDTQFELVVINFHYVSHISLVASVQALQKKLQLLDTSIFQLLVRTVAFKREKWLVVSWTAFSNHLNECTGVLIKGNGLVFVPALTFLILEPELLLHLLAGEVDVTAELGAVQSLGDVMAAVLLDEGQELVTCAVCRQRFQNLREPWKGDTSQGDRTQNFSEYWWTQI